MHTRAKMQIVASDRARRENVPKHILFLQETCIKRFMQDWMMSDVLLSVSFYVDE